MSVDDKPIPTVDDLLGVHRLRRERDELKRINRDLLEQVRIAAERVDAMAAIVGEPTHPPPIFRRETRSGLREATAIAIASDWHVEETVEAKTICGANEYNQLVARRRAARFFEGIEALIEAHRGTFKIRDMVLGILGDMITGYIHEELVEGNSLSPTEATLFAQEMLTSGIMRLLDGAKLERLVVACCFGNHGRTTAKRRIATGAANSFEWLMYHSLKQRFATDPRVEFVIADGSHLYFQTYDFTSRFHHGDDVKYWGGVGGITVPIRKAIAAWQTFRFAHFTWMGHFHTLIPDIFGAGTNGSLIGFSPFALSVKADMEPPQQLFALIDSRRGKCQMTPLWVDEVDPIAGQSVGAARAATRLRGVYRHPDGRTLRQLAADTGIAYRTLADRASKGITGDDLITPPHPSRTAAAARMLEARRAKAHRPASGG